jgi:hypothetical protein
MQIFAAYFSKSLPRNYAMPFGRFLHGPTLIPPPFRSRDVESSHLTAALGVSNLWIGSEIANNYRFIYHLLSPE